MSVLDNQFVSRLRRNHGLEHATINILNRKGGRAVPRGGISDFQGFWIVGELDTVLVADAATEALGRLLNGEKELAITPTCGTMYATYGISAGLGAFIATVGSGRRWRDKLERFPLIALFATLGIILSRPLAWRLQRQVTTSPDPGSLQITSVTKTQIGGMTAHRIKTKD